MTNDTSLEKSTILGLPRGKKHTIVSLRKALQEAYLVAEYEGGWRKVGENYQISGGMAYRIALQGYEPKDNHIREKLGLPVLAPAPVCPHCGQVHLARGCRASRSEKRPWCERSEEEVAFAIQNREEF